MTPIQEEKIVRHYLTAYNRFDINGMLKDLHPDIQFTNVSGGAVSLQLNGINAFHQQAEEAA